MIPDTGGHSDCISQVPDTTAHKDNSTSWCFVERSKGHCNQGRQRETSGVIPVMGSMFGAMRYQTYLSLFLFGFCFGVSLAQNAEIQQYDYSEGIDNLFNETLTNLQDDLNDVPDDLPCTPCEDHRGCYRREEICDGLERCLDGTDERGCFGYGRGSSSWLYGIFAMGLVLVMLGVMASRRRRAELARLRASSRRSMIIPGGRLSRSISPRGVLPILPGVLQNSSRLHLRLDSENTGGAFLNPTMLQPPPYEAVTHPTACELPPYDDPSHSHTPDVQVDPKESPPSYESVVTGSVGAAPSPTQPQ